MSNHESCVSTIPVANLAPHWQSWRARFRKTARRAVALLATAALLAGGAAALLRRPLGNEGPRGASIADEPAVRHAALLPKAFALPVAAAYERGRLDYERNALFCGSAAPSDAAHSLARAPTFCAPTTAVNVAQSLGAPVDRMQALDRNGPRAIFGILRGGLALDEEADVLRQTTGRAVSVLRDLDLAGFRAELMHANDPGRRYTVNFSRPTPFGRGGGHHSPVGAYLVDEDLVLLLDVDGKLEPRLVPTERLFRAVDTIDWQSNRKRGLLRIEEPD